VPERAREPSFRNALAFAQELIRIPSPPGGEEAVARRVAEEMHALGMVGVRVDAAGNVVGRVVGEEDGPTVMLSSHLDVVAAGDPEAWEHPPFSGVLERGFLHGRAAMDIERPLALQTYAAAALARRAPGDIVVAHTVYEERGGLGMKRLLDSGRVAPDVVIIGEATHGDICVGHRGRAEVEVVLRGVAGHASAPDRARNALDLLPSVLAAVRALADRQPSDPVLGDATLVATTVDVLPESRNVIPDRVVVAVDWRVLPDQAPEGLVAAVEAAIREQLGEDARAAAGSDGEEPFEVRMATERQRCWTGEVEEESDLFTPGFLVDDDHPVVVAASTSVGKRHGRARATVRPWTFATDGGWSCGIHGIPTFGFAPGEERFAHTNRERLALEEAAWAFERYPPMILAVMTAVAGS